jgi:hypothetical protein
MAKSLRSLAIIAVCIVVLFFGYEYFYAKPLQKQIDTTKTTVVTQLSALSNLETARMTLEKIVEWKQWLEDLIPGKNWDNVIQKFLFQDSIQMIAYADIVAGFDLSKVTSGSILVGTWKNISITLPAAKILSASLTKDTKPFVRKLGLLNNWDLQLETEVRNKTVEAMTQEAIDKGILEAAEKNAQVALKTIVASIWYTLISVVISQ